MGWLRLVPGRQPDASDPTLHTWDYHENELGADGNGGMQLTTAEQEIPGRLAHL